MARTCATVMAAVLALLAGAGQAFADRIDELSTVVEKSPDEKTRLAAVVSLGRLSDPRGVPALIRALGDRSPLVRGLAATALGHIGDVGAIPALERALSDDDEEVRSRVRDALLSLRSIARAARVPDSARVAPKEPPRLGAGRKPARVSVSAAHVSRGPKELAARLRRALVLLLQQSPELTFDPVAADSRHFVLDAAIAGLARVNNGPWVEVSCQVKVTISTPDGRILSIVTGGATVQAPRRRFRPTLERSLQGEAVDHAARGAYDNLVAFLARHERTK